MEKQRKNVRSTAVGGVALCAGTMLLFTNVWIVSIPLLLIAMVMLEEK